MAKYVCLQLVRFLEYYRGISNWHAYTAKMVDIDLDRMTLTCNHRTLHIPFDPPLSSYREVRARTIAMDDACIRGLGRSDVTINETVPPRGLNLAEFIAIPIIFVAFSQRWWFAADGPLATTPFLPRWYVRFCWIMQPWVLALMLGVHSAEAVWFSRARLRRHSVCVRSRVWWAWVGYVLVEGGFAIWRFGQLVKRKRAEKEKQRH